MANENMSIQTIVEAYYLPEKRQRRRANTVEGYESSFRLYVIPKFGENRITELTPDTIQDWVYELVDVCGAGGAEKAFKCLRQVIKWAIRKWLLFIPDPTLSVEMPRKKKYKFDTLTQRRLKKLVRGFVNHKHEASVIISAALGLRPGENMFLHWQDIDWRTGKVPVCGTLQEVKGVLYEYETKTVKGDRDCFLPAWALNRLHQIWVALGRPKGRIIGNLKPSLVIASIQRHIKKFKLPRITMKNLRHTWGTLAAQAGVKIENVAAMMGHSDIQTTYQYYYALTAATAKREQRKVARWVLGKSCDDMYKGIDLELPEPLPIAA